MQTKEFKQKQDAILNEISNLKSATSTPVLDGVIDIESYLNSDLKILWINKEVNSEDDTDEWSLIDTLYQLQNTYANSSDWSKTFNPIIFTLYSIFYNTTWAQTPDVNKQPEILNIIRNIAYINVKKIPGGAVANQSELLKHSTENDIIEKQLKLFQPNVIICGGTIDIMDPFLHSVYGDEYTKMKELPTENKMKVYYNDKMILIDAYHPNNRTLTQEEYCDTVSQAVLGWNKEKRKK